MLTILLDRADVLLDELNQIQKGFQMGALDLALKHQDEQAFNGYDNGSEWTEFDKQKAKDKLYDSIMNGAAWDENLESYRADMLIDIERIMLDKEDDKEARIKSVMYVAIKKHCEYEVKMNPDKYCEVDDD